MEGVKVTRLALSADQVKVGAVQVDGRVDAPKIARAVPRIGDLNHVEVALRQSERALGVAAVLVVALVVVLDQLSRRVLRAHGGEEDAGSETSHSRLRRVDALAVDDEAGAVVTRVVIDVSRVARLGPFPLAHAHSEVT